MINLVGTSELLQLVTTDATTTLEIHASGTDWDGTTFTVWNQHTAITGAGTTTVVAAPTGTNKRNVKYLSIIDTHATLPQTITVEVVNAASTKRICPKFTLAAGEGAINDDGTWFAFNADSLAVKAGAVVATALTAGIVELATPAEALGGADATRAVTAEGVGALWEKGANVASAGTITLGDGGYFHITGTTGITDIDFAVPADGRSATLIFDGILTLTHNATTLVLPGGVDIITGPGDRCTIVQDSGDNMWVVHYERAVGTEDSAPKNASVVNQSIAAATTAYLANSNIAIPPSLLRLKTVLRWTMDVTKTAAGTAANIWLVKLGTAGTTGDATILTFTTGVGTAVADTGRLDIEVVIRGPLGASCIAVGLFTMSHNLAATGLLIIPTCCIQVVSGAFNSTTANLIAGIACTTAAATVLNFQQVTAESANL